MYNSELLRNPSSTYPHSHAASIAIAPTDDIFVTWYAYPEDETRDAVLMLARRRPGARLFDKPIRIMEQLTKSLGNPVIFFDQFGTLHLLFVSLHGHYWDSAKLYATNSENLGQTWSTPHVLQLSDGVMLRYPPIVRTNTYMLLPAYNEKTNQTVMLMGGPDGEGWYEVDHFDGLQAIQGNIVRRDEKNLTMILRPYGQERCCMRCMSSDDGKTWMPVMRTTLPNPLSGAAAFSMDGTLCVVYNHTTEHRRYPISFSSSTNQGTSWSEPIHLDATEHELSYPAFTVDKNGVAHGVYTFGRTAIQYVAFDTSWWKNHGV